MQPVQPPAPLSLVPCCPTAYSCRALPSPAPRSIGQPLLWSHYLKCPLFLYSVSFLCHFRRLSLQLLLLLSCNCAVAAAAAAAGGILQLISTRNFWIVRLGADKGAKCGVVPGSESERGQGLGLGKGLWQGQDNHKSSDRLAVRRLCKFVPADKWGSICTMPTTQRDRGGGRGWQGMAGGGSCVARM